MHAAWRHRDRLVDDDHHCRADHNDDRSPNDDLNHNGTADDDEHHHRSAHHNNDNDTTAGVRGYLQPFAWYRLHGTVRLLQIVRKRSMCDAHDHRVIRILNQ
jgi:hypothetical protein